MQGTKTHKNEPNSGHSTGYSVMNPDTRSSDAGSPRASAPDATNELTEWLLQIGQVLGHAKRLAILLTLDVGAVAVRTLQGQVGLSKSSVHRHLAVLKGAGVVSEEVLGFAKGPRTGYGLTPFGQQLLAVLKGLRQYQEPIEPSEPAKKTASRGDRLSSARQVQVRHVSVCQLLVELVEFYQWLVVHGVFDGDRFRHGMRRLHVIAKDAGIDLQTLLNSEAEELPSPKRRESPR